MAADPALTEPSLRVRVATAMADIPAAAWNACAQHGYSSGEISADERNPFISHQFLLALERSGSAQPRTGWGPAHILVEDAEGALLGCAPAYVKGHSQGEYVFDHAWADAYERAGGRYYPKIQVSVPFTPATGPRLLIHPDAPQEAAREALIAGLRALRREVKASSIHVTFALKPEWDALGEAGFLQRMDHQFHWMNEGYGSFDDFLATLASRKRKALKRERRDALAPGITIEHLTGEAIHPEHWDAFFAFYQDTGSRKWGRPYLTRAFFDEIGATMADRILLVMARRDGRYIAGALNFIGAQTLYGRHWGCTEHHPFLHFEVCYYQAIDFAISRGLSRVEAGAQGEHKLARGYRPVLTYSAHDIPDPAFRRAVADYLARETRYIEALEADLEEMTPFRDGVKQGPG